MEKRFNIQVHIAGYEGSSSTSELASEIVGMVAVLQKPSMFKKVPWYIIDLDTGELLAYNAAYSPVGTEDGEYIADIVHEGYC